MSYREKVIKSELRMWESVEYYDDEVEGAGGTDEYTRPATPEEVLGWLKERVAKNHPHEKTTLMVQRETAITWGTFNLTPEDLGER